MTPSSTTVRQLLQQRVTPVAWPRDVERLFRALSRRPGCVWLDSAGGPAPLARWSVLSAEPAWGVQGEGGHPLRNLGEALAAVRVEGGGGSDEPLPFGPGFYGAISYDLAPHIEATAALAPRRDVPLPDLWFGLYPCVLVLDHLKRRAFLAGEDGPSRAALQEACAAAEAEDGFPLAPPAIVPRETACNLTRRSYEEAVRRALEYIAAGDIYQVNLSRRLTVTLPGGDPAAALPGLYLRLRRANPAPYAAYLDLGNGRAVLSSSPELFLDLGGGRVVTRPIKGTRPRTPGNETLNRRRRDDLLASAKDRAELVMIVDLLRNDLGRVCSYGSVRVTEPRALEAYAAVYHTVATVEGRLHAGRGVMDLLKATFPGGSITGAPKVRAMQIIAELEPTRRGFYTGAIGYLGPAAPEDPAGRCVLNVAIRTLLADGPRVHLQVGGGIVADSRPEAEYDETADKARALLAALGLDAMAD
jgi:para-aminobenzoate synthetase component I